MTRRLVSQLLTLTLLAASLTTLCNAQSATATIVGTVVDPQGAVLQGATVVARKVDTGIERTTKTTSDGLYRFDSLPPGVYDIRVEAQGFGKSEVKAVRLQVGELRDVNVTLSVSGKSEVVDISAAAPLIETAKTDVSNVIDEKQVATLPTTTSFNGIGGVANDYAGLAVIAPGVK